MAVPFVMMAVLFCSFQCTNVVGQMFPIGDTPEIVLLKEKEVPLWPVYSASENLPSTNIFFVVRSLSDDLEVWADCPGGDLDVKVTPVCTRYTLSVSAKEGFSGSSYVRILSRDGSESDELEIEIELGRIVPEVNEVTVSREASEHTVSIESNMKFYAGSYDGWIDAEAGEDGISFKVAPNDTGVLREGKVIVHDIYEVVTAEIRVIQMP